MKKAFIVCLAIILALCGVSCKRVETVFDGTKELNISIFETDGFDYFSEANHEIEIKVTDKREKNTQAEPWNEGAINGMNYRAQYIDSTIGYRWKDKTDNYQDNNDEREIRVRINQDTGEIDYYFHAFNDKSHLVIEDIGVEDCRRIAQQYLSKYVDDISDYSVVKEDCHPSIKRYYFVFAKTVNGVRLSKARISVYFDGTIGFHDFTELGYVLERELPSQDNMNKLKAAVDSKMQAIYEEKYDYNYEVVDTVFLRLADGTYAMEYYIDVELTSKSSGDVGPNERIRLIALLEDVE